MPDSARCSAFARGLGGSPRRTTAPRRDANALARRPRRSDLAHAPRSAGVVRGRGGRRERARPQPAALGSRARARSTGRSEPVVGEADRPRV